MIKGFTAQIQGALGQVELITNERNGLIEARKSDVEIYVSNNKALTDYYNALTENQKAKLEKSRLEIDKAATELKAIIDSELSINSLKERVLEALSNVSAQVLSAALNAVNTSVTHGTSTSENTSEQWTHGESLRESHAHTYVEKVT